MALRWAAVMNCKWPEDENLKITVFEAMKDKSKLPTPLNIEQFAISTAKKKLDKDELLEKINTKSIETARSFAQEIKIMSADKIVFLSFPYISGYFSVDFVKDTYQELVRELKIEDALDFTKVLEWFKDDKIDISYYKWKETNIIGFSHPSYSKAIGFAISGNGHTPSAGKIFNSVLLKLADNKDAIRDVSNAVANNFANLSDNVQNLLLKLADNKDAIRDVANAVANNFDKMPESVRNKLLLRIADYKEAAYSVSKIVEDNFDKLKKHRLDLCDHA